MKRFLSLAASGVLTLTLIGCVAEAPSKQTEPTLQAPPAMPASSPSSYEKMPEVIPMKEVTLVDQDYTGVGSLKGAEWLRAIKTQLVKGDITDGELVVTLERGGDNTSWSAAGMYFARAAQGEGFTYPDETSFGTRLHFLSAEWRGTCGSRSLAPNASFGVLKEHEATLTIPLREVRMTKGDDGCETGTVTHNLLDMINDTGLYMGFAPSDRKTAPYMKVVLRYRGTLDIKPF